MYELTYTASPKGLLSGRSGFTTVAMTRGFPVNLISVLENLSAYRPLFPVEDPHADKNPVNCSFQYCTLGSMEYAVLSRNAYAGLSYTGRSNNLAQHLVFAPEELAALPMDPAAILEAEENFTPWTGTPRELPMERQVLVPCRNRETAHLWAELYGDDSWRYFIAEKFLENPEKPLILEYDPLQITVEELLGLIGEVTALLPPPEKTLFTFSTYSYNTMLGNKIFFRAYPSNFPMLSNIKKIEPDSVISVGKTVPAFERSVFLKEENTARVVFHTDIPIENASFSSIPEEPAKTAVAEDDVEEIKLDPAKEAGPFAGEMPPSPDIPVEEERNQQPSRLIYMISFFLLILLIGGCLIFFALRENTAPEKGADEFDLEELPAEKKKVPSPGKKQKKNAVSGEKKRTLSGSDTVKKKTVIKSTSNRKNVTGEKRKRVPEKTLQRSVASKSSGKTVKRSNSPASSSPPRITVGDQLKLLSVYFNGGKWIFPKRMKFNSFKVEFSRRVMKEYITEHPRKFVIHPVKTVRRDGITEKMPDKSKADFTIQLEENGLRIIRGKTPSGALPAGIPRQKDVQAIVFDEKYTFVLRYQSKYDNYLKSRFKFQYQRENGMLKMFLIPPPEFIALAENCGLDIEIEGREYPPSSRLLLGQLDLDKLRMAVRERNNLLEKILKLKKEMSKLKESGEKYSSELKKQKTALHKSQSGFISRLRSRADKVDFSPFREKNIKSFDDLLELSPVELENFLKKFPAETYSRELQKIWNDYKKNTLEKLEKITALEKNCRIAQEKADSAEDRLNETQREFQEKNRNLLWIFREGRLDPEAVLRQEKKYVLPEGNPDSLFQTRTMKIRKEIKIIIRNIER